MTSKAVCSIYGVTKILSFSEKLETKTRASGEKTILLFWFGLKFRMPAFNPEL